MRLGHDPRFKFLVSRAVYKGILRYVSSQYDLPYVVQPLPVEAFAAEFAAAGEVALSWSPAMDPLEATAAPPGYVVYTRVDDGVTGSPPATRAARASRARRSRPAACPTKRAAC